VLGDRRLAPCSEAFGTAPDGDQHFSWPVAGYRDCDPPHAARQGPIVVHAADSTTWEDKRG
jgi:hypothetical protein